MEEKIKTFATFGDAGHGGITRFTLSAEDQQARNYYRARMEKIGATVTVDDWGCMYATIAGSDPSAKRIVTGSHCDSVKNGGNYDGILGVIGGMEVLETIVAQKIPHRHPITAMIWTNEEGSLYPPALMVCGVLCNEYLPKDIAKNYLPEKMYASKSRENKEDSFGQALERSGFKGDKANRLSKDQYKCMLELHIEQGPILEAAKKDVGVVTCVLGMFNYRIRARGQSDHAGTTPMPYRKDALFAAAQALMYLHTEIDKLGVPDLVYTTGEIQCHPCVHTVIPDDVDFSLDVRHVSKEVLEKVRKIVLGLPQTLAQCAMSTTLMWERDTVQFDSKLVEYVQIAADKLNIPNQKINSGAGHDAQFCAYMIPTTMVFVQSKDGHSHCEEEYSTVQQCTNGASVLLNAILMADKE